MTVAADAAVPVLSVVSPAVVADKPSVVERCRFCREPIYECDGYCPGSGKQVRR